MEVLFNNKNNIGNSILIIDKNFKEDNSKININYTENNLTINDNLCNNFQEILNSENNQKLEEILSNNIINQEDINIIYLVGDKNIKKYSLVSLLINEKILNEKNINDIQFSFIEIDFESTNVIRNIIKKQILNLNIFKIPESKIQNKSLDYFEFKITFNNSENISYIKYYIIYKNFDKILSILSDNKKDNDIKILIEKINIFIDFEKEYLKKLNLFPSIQNQMLINIENYKNECIEYYNTLIKQIEDMKNKIINNNDFKDCNTFLQKLNDFINKYGNIQSKEISVYQSLLEFYTTKEEIIINSNLNYEPLKDLLIQLNITNQEILNLLQKYNLKKIINNENKNQKSEVEKRILNLENNNLKEKEKEIRVLTGGGKKNINSIKKGRSISTEKSKFENNDNCELSIANKEIKNLKLRINELLKIKNNFQNLKQENYRLKNENDKLLIEIEKIRKNNLNIKSKESEDNKTLNSNSSKNSITRNKINVNLINPESLLLLKKIQEENKEITKQLNDFKTKNNELKSEIKRLNHLTITNENTLNTNYSCYINRSSSDKKTKKIKKDKSNTKINFCSSSKNILSEKKKK